MLSNTKGKEPLHRRRIKLGRYYRQRVGSSPSPMTNDALRSLTTEMAVNRIRPSSRQCEKEMEQGDTVLLRYLLDYPLSGWT